jgi:cytidylate kinase
MVRVITIGREYGSGGGSIARTLAERLGWRLIDEPLIAEIARATNTPAESLAEYEERVDPWFHRIMKSLWRGGFEGTVARADAESFDSAAVARLWHHVIVQAAETGNCVAVGRGGQCLLQQRPDTFHVYVYAPMRDRVERLRGREPRGCDLTAAARARDLRRRDYIRHHFDQDWTNPHLYHLMLCSSIGLDRAADTILYAAELEEVAQ